jgi:putative polyketide hydroxylase
LVADVPLDAYRIGGAGDFADPDGRWPAAYGITNDGAVLVRPDGFVAWRSVGTVDDPARVLTSALSEVLVHDQAITTA